MKSHPISLFVVHKPFFPHLENLSNDVLFLARCSFTEIKTHYFKVYNFDIVEKWVCYRLKVCTPPKPVC